MCAGARVGAGVTGHTRSSHTYVFSLRVVTGEKQESSCSEAMLTQASMASCSILVWVCQNLAGFWGSPLNEHIPPANNHASRRCCI